jgi:hypothetical protein
MILWSFAADRKAAAGGSLSEGGGDQGRGEESCAGLFLCGGVRVVGGGWWG